MVRKKLLYGVAGAMSAAAALAIGILLVGDFGGTEGRILFTTLLLAVHAALTVPAAMLWDQGRLPRLAAACVALAAVAAALNVTAVWAELDNETYGRLLATVMFLLVATVVTTALATQRRHRLFVPSVALLFTAALMAAAAIWSETERGGYLRLLGAVVVLTGLLVALQPLLLRAQRERNEQRLRLVDDTGEVHDVVVFAGSLADAAAQAIKGAERAGRHVHSVEVR